MPCEQQTSGNGSDTLQVVDSPRLFDRSATAWLLGQAVRHLNAADREGELAYSRVVEVLRHCASTDLVETVNGLFRQVRSGDSSLRWCLLYVLGDAGDRGAADFLLHVSLRPMPEAKDEPGCQTDRDMEILVGTMAIHALRNIAGRHPDAAEHVLKIVSARPIRPLLVEAVKVAGELGLKNRVREILPKDDHWMLDIRKARIEELFAEPERQDGKERGFTPPRSGSLYTAPHAGCCAGKER